MGGDPRRGTPSSVPETDASGKRIAVKRRFGATEAIRADSTGCGPLRAGSPGLVGRVDGHGTYTMHRSCQMIDRHTFEHAA